MSILFYVSLLLLFIAILRFLVALLNYLTRPILPYGKAVNNPLVSVLIPARNEEQNISRLIGGLLNQSYSNLEIIVYNDQSTDRTSDIVSKFIQDDNRVSLINGEGLPNGWLGKNYGCHNLAQASNGVYLLYLDADVKVSHHFIENSVAFMQRKRIVLLSMFPKQEIYSFGEKMVVPSMNWILLSLLFIRLVRWSKRRSLAAANGQMMMFDAKVYKENWWHEKVKSSAVEDIGISRMIKRKKLRMATLLGTDDISCRMYGSYSEAIKGFTKNVTAFFGGSVLVMLFFVLIGTIGPILVLISLPFPLAFLYFFCLLSARMLIAKLSEQSLIINVLLWPLQHLAFLHLVYKALIFARKRSLTWKDREVGLRH